MLKKMSILNLGKSLVRREDSVKKLTEINYILDLSSFIFNVNLLKMLKITNYKTVIFKKSQILLNMNLMIMWLPLYFKNHKGPFLEMIWLGNIPSRFLFLIYRKILIVPKHLDSGKPFYNPPPKK